MTEVQKLRWGAYERYRLRWMASHGKTVSGLFSAVSEYAESLEEDEDRICDKHAMAELFDDWEREYGFDGEIWACYDEFLGAEYLDFDYMVNQFSGKEQALYVQDYCQLTNMLTAKIFVAANGRAAPVSRECVLDPEKGTIKHIYPSSGDFPSPHSWVSAWVYIDRKQDRMCDLEKDEKGVWRVCL